jgi:hypothetical protein
MPVARPEPVPPAPADVVYGIGRIDASGRIVDRAVTEALGWRGGDRLTLTADAGDVLPGRLQRVVPSRSHRSMYSASPLAYAPIVRGARRMSVQIRSQPVAWPCRTRTGTTTRQQEANASRAPALQNHGSGT